MQLDTGEVRRRTGRGRAARPKGQASCSTCDGFTRKANSLLHSVLDLIREPAALPLSSAYYACQPDGTPQSPSVLRVCQALSLSAQAGGHHRGAGQMEGAFALDTGILQAALRRGAFARGGSAVHAWRLPAA